MGIWVAGHSSFTGPVWSLVRSSLKCFIGEPAFLYTESAFKGRVSTKRSIEVHGTEVSLLWFKTEDISAAMRARTLASGGGVLGWQVRDVLLTW